MATLRVFPKQSALNEKALHNLINAKVRHCRIGKVRLKSTVDINAENDPYRHLSGM